MPSWQARGDPGLEFKRGLQLGLPTGRNVRGERRGAVTLPLQRPAPVGGSRPAGQGFELLLE